MANLNGLEYQGTQYVANVSGFPGVTYSAAPEPASWAMALVAGAVFVLGVRMRAQKG